MNIKELEIELEKFYKKIIKINRYKDNIYDINLPLFLDNGDKVDLTLQIIDKNTIILRNDLYKSIEKSIKENVNNASNIKKEYLLNEEKFKNIVENIIIENEIEYGLTLKKTIIFDGFYSSFVFEIFKYSFNIIRYYNYIYNYILIHSKDESQSKLLKDAIKKFITIFNDKNNTKISKIEKEELNYSRNDYYGYNNEIVISGIGTKLSLHQVTDDIEELIDKKEYNRAIVFFEINKKNGLEKYVDKKMKNINSKNLNIKIVKIESINQIEEELYNIWK